jgi:hypothetical protein
MAKVAKSQVNFLVTVSRFEGAGRPTSGPARPNVGRSASLIRSVAGVSEVAGFPAL